MTNAIALVKRRGAGLLIVPVAVAIIAFAFALGSAEASGDEFGDSATPTGGIDGDPALVLGAPDGSIVQIGTDASAGVGSLTVAFTNNVAYDGAGDDLLVHVLDADAPATAMIEVSADGVTFVDVGDFADTADVAIDLDDWGLDYAVAVRITQVSGVLPGFDLDAVEALNQIDLDDLALVATPKTAENPGLTSHTVTANLTDLAVPVVGAVVSFSVTSGPNLGEDGTDVTDAAGDATFDYVGNGGVGTDQITVWLDVNDNGLLDGTEPSDLVTKTWHGVTGTIELTDLGGGGVVGGDTLQVEVVDADLDVTGAAEIVTVLVTSTSDPSGLTALVLRETGGSTGIFRGTLLLVETATSQGTSELLAASGDTITASYDDALDGTGNDPTPVTDDLVVTDVETEDDAAEQVTICHVPPGNPANQHTISVGSSAVDAHVANHGDTLGECGVYDGPTKQESQLASFCERRPDHARCDNLDSPTQSSANLEVTGGDVEDVEDVEAGKPADFCEGRPDHKRCDGGADVAQGSTNPAVEDGHGDVGNSKLAAFCEHKPDHKRCEGLDD